MITKTGEYGYCTLICLFISNLTCGLYLSRVNYLNDVVWALPIVVVSSALGLFCLDYYNSERKKEIEND